MALVVDTGPLLASMDRTDRHHSSCRALLEGTQEPLVIPGPVLVELDYWIHQRLRPDVFVTLLDDIVRGAMAIAELRAEDYPRIRDLCRRYADADIGVVDASVLAIVERLGETKLATLDRRHFGILRPRHVDALSLLP